MKCGSNKFAPGDPLITLENKLKHVKYVAISGVHKSTGTSIPIASLNF